MVLLASSWYIFSSKFWLKLYACQCLISSASVKIHSSFVCIILRDLQSSFIAVKTFMIPVFLVIIAYVFTFTFIHAFLAFLKTQYIFLMLLLNNLSSIFWVQCHVSLLIISLGKGRELRSLLAMSCIFIIIISCLHFFQIRTVKIIIFRILFFFFFILLRRVIIFTRK